MGECGLRDLLWIQQCIRCSQRGLDGILSLVHLHIDSEYMCRLAYQTVYVILTVNGHIDMVGKRKI